MQSLDTTYTYDTYGNKLTTREHGSYGTLSTLPTNNDALDRITALAYDSIYHAFEVTNTNPLGHATTTTYDFQLSGELPLGLSRKVTDPNGAIKETKYDQLGRTFETWQPGASQATVKTIYPVASGPNYEITAPYVIQIQFWDQTGPGGAQYRSAWAFYDGIGRVIRTVGPAEDTDHYIQSDKWYNALGEVGKESRPYDVILTPPPGVWSAPTWSSLRVTTTTYDGFKRVTEVSFPLTVTTNVITRTIYDGRKTTVVDPNNHQQVSIVDDFGRLIQVEEYSGTNPYTLYATTTYSYDARDLMTGMTDAQGNVTTLEYDGLERKVRVDDPNLGEWFYTYDRWGQVICQADARTGANRGVIRSEYDKLNRITQREAAQISVTLPISESTCQTLASSLPTVATFTYDSTASGNKGIGRQTGITSYEDTLTVANHTIVYNLLGLVVSNTREVDVDQNGLYDYTFTTTSTYDLFGRTLTQTLPDPDGT